MNQAVLFEKKGPVGEIILNRPEQLNAMNFELMKGLFSAVEQCQDPAVRAVILKGNGRCFCAGGDINFFHQLIQEGKPISTEMPDTLHEMVEGLRNLEKPILASVQGAAAGGGAPLALACDMVIAAEDAIFNFAYAQIGLTPDGSSTYFLPRHVGMKKACELFMTIPSVSAREAKELGLINWTVPANELKEKTESIATQLANGPTRSFARLKKLLNETYTRNLHDQLALETKMICESSRTDDFREGVTSFLEKRVPNFKGS